MKVEAKAVRRDNDTWIACVNSKDMIIVEAKSPAELAAILTYLQRAASCPPDRVRFTPEPMTWEHPTPWVWCSGDYTIIAAPKSYELRYRDDICLLRSSLDEAQQAAERHRESS